VYSYCQHCQFGTQSYYALPSWKAKVTNDDRVTVNALLDNGSEVNMMPRRVFDQLNLPIDTEIRSHINAYNTDTNLEDCGLTGVCHDVLISIGSIELGSPSWTTLGTGS
jgi:hypothetical protein